MKMTVQPARRAGASKQLFSDDLEECNVIAGERGGVTLSFVAVDVYTKNAKQHFELTLHPADLVLVLKASGRG